MRSRIAFRNPSPSARPGSEAETQGARCFFSRCLHVEWFWSNRSASHQFITPNLLEAALHQTNVKFKLKGTRKRKCDLHWHSLWNSQPNNETTDSRRDEFTQHLRELQWKEILDRENTFLSKYVHDEEQQEAAADGVGAGAGAAGTNSSSRNGFQASGAMTARERTTKNATYDSRDAVRDDEAAEERVKELPFLFQTKVPQYLYEIGKEGGTRGRVGSRARLPSFAPQSAFVSFFVHVSGYCVRM